MQYTEIFVKNALSRSKLQATDYALNPYRGCEHQCVYCYSPYVLHIPIEEWRKRVYVKVNLPTVLNKELKRKKGFITIGTVTDAYQPAEQKYEITRKSLRVLLKHQARISILTKSSLILRDLDIIKNFQEAHIGVTITTLNDALRRKIEPNSDSVDSRLQVIDEFTGKAITYAFIGPIFPEITEPYLEDIVKEIRNVDYVIFDRFRWKKGMVLPQYLREIDLSDKYYHRMKEKVKKIVKKYNIKAYFEF